MSFGAYESSLDAGEPIRLYRITLADTVWRFTSATHDVTTEDGNVWKSAAISDDGVKQTGEAASDILTVVVPISIGPVQVYLVTPPAHPMQLAILAMHEESFDIDAIWAGEVVQVNPATPGQAKISCESTAASMKREGLRLAWQRTCPYALYDDLTCKAPKANFAVPMIVIGKSGFTLFMNTDGGKDSGWFDGGFIEWVHPVRGREYRGISSQQGGAFTIFGVVDDIYEGLRVTAYPGCPRTHTACKEKFNNLPNNGAFRHMPGKSPFDGDPVFIVKGSGS